MTHPLESPVPQKTGRASAVVFDLDGTLTRPSLDFDAIRREIGLPTEPRTPILEALAGMPPQDRARAEDILLNHEDKAAMESTLQDDAAAVLETIRRHGIRTGLITRNSRRSVTIVLTRHNLCLDHVHTREDGPFKPSPEPVLTTCRALGVAPESAWVVGDYLFDVLSGKGAGATTVLMIGEAPRPPYADQADHVIRRLSDLLALLRI